MNIIPAIDLYLGKIVRLRQGDFAAQTPYDFSAQQLLQNYQAAGLTRVHIVDLSGAEQGFMQQDNSIKALCASSDLKCQVGGGIRTTEQITALLAAGVDRVVIGSLAVEQPELVQQWLTEFGGDRIILAIDVQIVEGEPYVMTKGWQQNSGLCLPEVLSWYENDLLKSVLCTDIACDGAFTGPNINLYQYLQHSYPKIEWLASGGVSTVRDLSLLNAIGINNVIVGKAIYENRISLKQCQEALQW